MKLHFYGGAKMVTGANYLIDTGRTKLLIDCGMAQGSRFAEDLNYDPFPYDPKEIDFVCVTHAHIDHIGRVPKLYKYGFKGKFLTTPATGEFAELLLTDSEHLIRREAERRGRTEPFYDLKDVETAFKNFEGIEYDNLTKLSKDVSIRFRDAGHILGSSIIEVFVKEGGKTVKIVFSGDLGNSPNPLLRDVSVIDEADYLLVESTYGARIHETFKERKELLEDAIEDTVRAGGTLMIPSFAMERTQDLLYEINDLVEKGRIPRVPIFLDSPLAIKATRVYKQYSQYYNPKAEQRVKSGDDLFKFPGLKFTLKTDESKAINTVKPPKVIIAGAGMLNGGRILHHAKRYLTDPDSMLLVVGYQARGSLGRSLVDLGRERKRLGDPGLTTEVKIHGDKITARAKIRAIGGYSAHADQPRLLKWISPIRHQVKKVFIVQGEEDQATVLARKLRDEMAIDAVIPDTGDEFELM